MNCTRVRELLTRYKPGEQVAISQAEEAELKQHLMECTGCRTQYERIRADGGRHESSVASKEIGTLGTRDSVISAKSRKWALPALFGALTVFAAVAAVIVVINKGRPSGEPDAANRPADTTVGLQPTSSSSSATGHSLASGASLADLWKQAEATFRKAGVHGTRADFAKVISRCQEIVRHWPDSKESIEARKLVFRCYTEMGEMRLAQEAFWTYAVALGDRARGKILAAGGGEEKAQKEAMLVTCREVLNEAQRLIDARDYEAMRYYAEIVRRYPGTDLALKAQEAMGQHNLRIADSSSAVETLERIVREAPDSPEGQKARVSLPAALFNSGRKQEAVQSWLEYAEKATQDNDRACGYYNAAVLLAASGQDGMAEAEKRLRQVVEKYPDSSYASSASKLLQKLSGE